VKKLKPFAFWIVCGVIVLIELGFLAFWGETDDQGHSPEEVKQSFDRVFKNLTDLHGRALQPDPEGEFDAESHQDMQRLTGNYIVTDQWTKRLQPVVDRYTQQRQDIHADLVKRSAFLHVPVFDSDDLSSWYDLGYLAKSKELLTELVSAHALALPEDGAPLDLEGDRNIRSMAGLFTKEKTYPDVDQHALLALRLHIIEKITAAVIKAKVKADANPVLGKLVPEPQADVGARMVNLTWMANAFQNGPPPQTVSADLVSTPIDFTLTLQGPLGALIACEAEIENISEPVMIVRGGKLSAKQNWKPGERKGLSVDSMTCVLNITVIDFSLKPTAPAAGAVPQHGHPELPAGIHSSGSPRPPSLIGGPPPALPGEGHKP
jgi:hypothetical protein